MTINGDTISGKMYLDLRDQYNNDRIRVKNESGKASYMPYQIKEAVIDQVRYVPFFINGKHQFAEVEHEGFASIYKIRGTDSETSSQFVQRMLVKEGGEIESISLLSFRKATEEFFADCVGESKYVDDYKIKNLPLIVEEYNECVKLKSREQEVAQSIKAKSLPDWKAFLQRISNSDLENKEDVGDMIGDIEYKLSVGKEIPSYLIEAVNSGLETKKPLLDEFNSLLAEYAK